MQEFNMPFSDKIASLGISFDVPNKKDDPIQGFMIRISKALKNKTRLLHICAITSFVSINEFCKITRKSEK